jgi:hypothetical protein
MSSGPHCSFITHCCTSAQIISQPACSVVKQGAPSPLPCMVAAKLAPRLTRTCITAHNIRHTCSHWLLAAAHCYQPAEKPVPKLNPVTHRRTRVIQVDITQPADAHLMTHQACKLACVEEQGFLQANQTHATPTHRPKTLSAQPLSTFKPRCLNLGPNCSQPFRQSHMFCAWCCCLHTPQNRSGAFVVCQLPTLSAQQHSYM